MKCKELQRYLDVYDLTKKGFTILEIIKKIGTPAQRESLNKMKLTTEELEELDKSGEHAYGPETIIRMYQRDLEKAENIIKNVEHGYFPGRYDPAQKKDNS